MSQPYFTTRILAFFSIFQPSPPSCDRLIPFYRLPSVLFANFSSSPPSRPFTVYKSFRIKYLPIVSTHENMLTVFHSHKYPPSSPAQPFLFTIHAEPYPRTASPPPPILRALARFSAHPQQYFPHKCTQKEQTGRASLLPISVYYSVLVSPVNRLM